MTDAQVLAMLAKSNGAILGWQLSTKDAEVFADCLNRGVIGIDGDLYTHLDAIKHTPDEPGDFPWWEMPATDVYRALERRGFTVEGTGGGCTAWRLELKDGGYCLITQELSHEFTMDDKIDIGFYNEDGDDWAAFSGAVPCKVSK